MNCNYAPVHVIEYYRYIRFWQHGTVTIALSIKKLKK